MTSPWKHLPTDTPNIGQTVWVRLSLQLSAPFQATWDGTAFTSTTNALTVPWYMVQAWRPI